MWKSFFLFFLTNIAFLSHAMITLIPCDDTPHEAVGKNLIKVTLHSDLQTLFCMRLQTIKKTQIKRLSGQAEKRNITLFYDENVNRDEFLKDDHFKLLLESQDPLPKNACKKLTNILNSFLLLDAYYRKNWVTLNPIEGKFDFNKIPQENNEQIERAFEKIVSIIKARNR